MPNKTIEERLSELEARVEQLAREKRTVASEATPWWRRVAGRFKDNPEFDEAMRLGREYRQSLRPADDQAAKP